VNLVFFKCAACNAPWSWTWINQLGQPHCPCSIAKILGDTAAKFVTLADSEYTEQHATRAAHWAFEARPDLRGEDLTAVACR
jgi:hypothetical protein